MCGGGESSRKRGNSIILQSAIWNKIEYVIWQDEWKWIAKTKNSQQYGNENCSQNAYIPKLFCTEKVCSQYECAMSIECYMHQRKDKWQMEFEHFMSGSDYLRN